MPLLKLKTLADDECRLSFASRMEQLGIRGLRKLPFYPPTRPYNLSISHQHRFIWYRVAKVGTRSLLRAFDDAGVALDARHPMNVYYSPADYQQYFKFAFVRNPWDRVVSCWYNKVKQRHIKPEQGVVRWHGLGEELLQDLDHFPRFVDYISGWDLTQGDPHLRLQTCLIDLDQVDFVGRFENYAEDVNHIFTRLNVAPPSLHTANKSRGRESYRQYYDAQTAAVIADLYSRDVSVFGYEF